MKTLYIEKLPINHPSGRYGNCLRNHCRLVYTPLWRPCVTQTLETSPLCFPIVSVVFHSLVHRMALLGRARAVIQTLCSTTCTYQDLKLRLCVYRALSIGRLPLEEPPSDVLVDLLATMEKLQGVGRARHARSHKQWHDDLPDLWAHAADNSTTCQAYMHMVRHDLFGQFHVQKGLVPFS